MSRYERRGTVMGIPPITSLSDRVTQRIPGFTGGIRRGPVVEISRNENPGDGSLSGHDGVHPCDLSEGVVLTIDDKESMASLVARLNPRNNIGK